MKLVPPIYVKPFVKRQKNDAADAEAICEAASRPTMRFVAVKSRETRPGISLSVAFALAPGLGLLALGPLSQGGAEPLHAASVQRSEAGIEPFTIDIPDDVLTDLRERLTRARLPDEPAGVGWQLGMNQAYLKQLIEYWRDEFDWRAQERRLNELEQFKTRIDGLDIHFSCIAGRRNRMPFR